MAAPAPWNPPIGTLPTLEWVPVTNIGVDPSYQRAIDNEQSQKFIRAIARDWDWSLCLPLKLARRDDGSVWAVDGQHRLQAARLRGDIPHLPCVIGRYQDGAEEAAAFVALNRQRRALTAVDLFKAALVAGDAQAVEVMAHIKAVGLRIAPHSNYTAWKPGQIYCIPGIVRAYRQRGPLPTSKALGTLATAFHGQVLRYAGLLLDGLYDVYAGRGRTGMFDRARFTTLLGSVEQAEWVRRALQVQARQGCSRASAMATAMLEAYDATDDAKPPALRAAPALGSIGTPVQPKRRTFEETMALVAEGKLTVSEKPVLVKAEPDGLFASGLA